MGSKNDKVRLRVASYFQVAIENSPLNVLELNQELIDLFLLSIIDDQNQEVRN